MAAVVNVDVDHLRGGDGVFDRLLRRLEDGIQQRAAFDGTRRSEGERDENAARRLHGLLPRSTGIARGEDVIQRDRPPCVSGQGRERGGVGGGHGWFFFLGVGSVEGIVRWVFSCLAGVLSFRVNLITCPSDNFPSLKSWRTSIR